MRLRRVEDEIIETVGHALGVAQLEPVNKTDLDQFVQQLVNSITAAAANTLLLLPQVRRID
ncbi:hypothetical protein AL485_24695 [Serratia liquefaciens]|nr:hypothetical protein AL485_24695 [Serratia liquefaciens]